MHDPKVLKPRFSLLKEMLKKHKNQSAGMKASQNPMKYMEDHKNMSIGNAKGIAFSRGGLVKK